MPHRKIEQNQGREKHGNAGAQMLHECVGVAEISADNSDQNGQKNHVVYAIFNFSLNITNAFLVIIYFISKSFITDGYNIIYVSLAAFKFFPNFSLLKLMLW